MKPYLHSKKVFMAIGILLVFGCLGRSLGKTPNPACIVVVNGTLIDGTGSSPILNAVLLIRDGKIADVGKKGQVKIPAGARVLDAKGGTILPGFINAHVHQGYNVENLRAWAMGGVTTVRDESLPGDPRATLRMRNTQLNKPEYARIVSAGPMMTKPDGYGYSFIDSPNDARQKTIDLIDAGVDAIKLSLEDGYAGQRGLPKLSREEIDAIVQSAHQRGVPVSAHITQGRYMETVVAAGVDDVAHMAYDDVSEEVMRTMIDRQIAWIPTFTVFRNYGAPLDIAVDNLQYFAANGGLVALGNDFAGGPGEFELGIPLFELTMMRQAKMTPMQIIVACTLNAAKVCRRDRELGTLEKGKIADLLIVTGEPLKNLNVLNQIRWVIKEGVIIRSPK